MKHSIALWLEKQRAKAILLYVVLKFISCRDTLETLNRAAKKYDQAATVYCWH